MQISSYIIRTVLLVLFMIIGFGSLIYSTYESNKLINKLKSGTYLLSCHIGDDYHVIDPNKIVTVQDDVYIFTNGYAQQCEVIR